MMKPHIFIAMVLGTVCTSFAAYFQGGNSTLAQDGADVPGPLGAIHQTIYVDNQGADPNVQDPDDLGTPEYPLHHIQDALDIAVNGATIIVCPANSPNSGPAVKHINSAQLAVK